MPSVKMGLQAINQTERLAKVISLPHGKAGAPAAKPTSWVLIPGWPSRPASLLTLY